MTNYVTYYRVSTARQGQSGLGLEAHEAAVKAFIASRGATEVGRFVEVESGKVAARPQLAAALTLAKAKGATLLIAKLDRLSRNVAFIANLLEAGVEVTAADMPSADRFMFHIMAAVAEHEAKAISQRTKAALQAAKARGKVLGFAQASRGPNAASRAAAVAAEARTAAANAYASRLGPKAYALRTRGHTLQQIATHFVELGVSLPRGGTNWTETNVLLLLRRYDALLADNPQTTAA
ncbi:resolvase [Agrobacterium tumefaciens]|uniref:recombinase family protein n=1 Tax=Agrobacterium tumefaciens TaxID=358 RepID=UPI00122FE3F5|nr:resolvase [Agrobacterium tumefaciens]